MIQQQLPLAPSPVGSLQNVPGESASSIATTATTDFVIIDPPLEDTFWQSMSLSEQLDDDNVPSDEAESEMDQLTRVSSREFRFYQEIETKRQWRGGSQESTTTNNNTTSTMKRRLRQTTKDPYLSYTSFSPGGSSDPEFDRPEDEYDYEEELDDILTNEGIVVLSDIEDEGETSSNNTNDNNTTSDGGGSSGSDSESTLPTSSPPNSPAAVKRTCKAPKKQSSFSSKRTGGQHIRKASITTNSTITNSSIGSYTGTASSILGEKKISHQHNQTTKITIVEKSGEKIGGSSHHCQESRNRSSSKHSRTSSSRTSSSSRTRSTNSSSSSPKKPLPHPLPHNRRSNKQRRLQLQEDPNRTRTTMAHHQHEEEEGDDDEEEESLQPTIMTRWQRKCEALWAPMLFFDLWWFGGGGGGDDGDWEDSGGRELARIKSDDEETLATFDDEMSYEDEGNVNVLVAVQATVLGTDFPQALDIPREHMPHIWGSNFVGMVHAPKSNTDAVHSRRFPPGCRVASISAWSATTHNPYITCNSSNLLMVPPFDGLHLDGTEVSVIAAAYLPAFQALHHGQRHHRNSAYDPTALEGQRVLILSHAVDKGPPKSSSLNQSLVDARVQAAVRMALWAGARDVHVTVSKAGNTKRNIFGNDYRVRLLDTPPEDWVPILKDKMDLVLDFTGPTGISFLKQSTCSISEKVLIKKVGRYVGCLGEDCCSPVHNCQEEAPIDKKNKSTWSEGLALLQGKQGCASPAILPEGKDIRHVMEWTAICMKMQRASLFDFHGSWKHDRRLAEQDFNFLLELLAKRQIRPHIAKVLDVDYFPSADAHQLRNTRPMSGAVVCEPWSQYKDSPDMSGSI